MYVWSFEVSIRIVFQFHLFLKCKKTRILTRFYVTVIRIKVILFWRRLIWWKTVSTRLVHRNVIIVTSLTCRFITWWQCWRGRGNIFFVCNDQEISQLSQVEKQWKIYLNHERFFVRFRILLPLCSASEKVSPSLASPAKAHCSRSTRTQECSGSYQVSSDAICSLSVYRVSPNRSAQSSIYSFQISRQSSLEEWRSSQLEWLSNRVWAFYGASRRSAPCCCAAWARTCRCLLPVERHSPGFPSLCSGSLPSTAPSKTWQAENVVLIKSSKNHEQKRIT